MSTTLLSFTPGMPGLACTPRRPSTQAPMPARRITSQDLLEGAREVVIRHQGADYHLRLTRNDKLILTK